MNVLCDFISFQSWLVGGGGKFAKIVSKELVSHPGITPYGLYDSSKQVHPCFLNFAKEHSILLLDISRSSAEEIVKEYRIERFFICVQSLLSLYDFRKVSCEVYVTVHDLRNHDIMCNDIRGRFVFHNAGLPTKIKQLIAKIYPAYTYRWAWKSIDIEMLRKENVHITTVSLYSKWAIYYYYPDLMKKEIPVFYPPLQTTEEMKEEVENEKLKSIIESGEPYFLLVSGGVPGKNVDLFLRCFDKLSRLYPSYRCVITGTNFMHPDKRVVTVGYLSESDLEQAYAHATVFIYPTYQEGFGYPPMEAMKYGVPCCISNVTSLPEVYGDSAAYFSPFYEADIFKTVLNVLDHLELYRQKSKEQYRKLAVTQERDLKKLVAHILS